MQQNRFDWRWMALIVVVAIIAGGRQLPWPVLMLALAGSGGYILYLGWQAWGRESRGSSSTRVTYWRGQRIEIPPERHRLLPSLQTVTPVIVYFLIGGIFVLSALAVLFRNIGDLGPNV